MTAATAELIADLTAIGAHVPIVIAGLTTRTLPPVTQHTFGALLIELGENLHHNADAHTPRTRRIMSESRSTNDPGSG